MDRIALLTALFYGGFFGEVEMMPFENSGYSPGYNCRSCGIMSMFAQPEALVCVVACCVIVTPLPHTHFCSKPVLFCFILGRQNCKLSLHKCILLHVIC